MSGCTFLLVIWLTFGFGFSEVVTVSERELDALHPQNYDFFGTLTCWAEDRFDSTYSYFCSSTGLYRVNSNLTKYVIVSSRDILQYRPVEIDLVAGSRSLSGYREGTRNEALFAEIADMIQITPHKFIVSDRKNNCLRLIEHGVTRTYAGKCGESESGYINGPAHKARFFAPVGLYLDGEKLYASDHYNNAIRVINMFRDNDGYRQVETFASLLNHPHPLYITCNYPCTKLYASTPKGVLQIDKHSKAQTLIKGDSTDGKAPRHLNNPHGVFWVPSADCLLVADHFNDRIVLLHENGYVSKVAAVQRPIYVTIGSDNILSVVNRAGKVYKTVFSSEINNGVASKSLSICLILFSVCIRIFTELYL